MSAIGVLSKAGFRVAPTDGIEINNADYVYPTSISDATTYNQSTLGEYDQIPFASESLVDQKDYEMDETLEASPAISEMDLISSLPSGSIDINGKYEGMDALLACAMGMEVPGVTDSPSFPDATDLTAGTCAASTWVNSAGVFVAGDVGKFITVTSATGAHQVRRISAYNSTTSVTITPNWDVTPPALSTAKMNTVFRHKFEFSKQLSVENWADVYSSYDTTGVLTSTDKIVRFGTLGIQKQVSDWMFRGCMVNSMNFDMQANTSGKFSFDLVPYDLNRGSYHARDWGYNNSPNFPQINRKIVFKQSVLYVKEFSTTVGFTSSDILCANGFTLDVNNNLKADDQDFCSGARRIEPTRAGERTVTGVISVPRYNSNTLLDYRDNQTDLMGKLIMTGDIIDGTEEFELVFWLPHFRLTNGTPNVADAGKLTQQYDFQCLEPTGAASGFPTQWDTDFRGELIIETQDMNPFNTFLNQNKEY